MIKQTKPNSVVATEFVNNPLVSYPRDLEPTPYSGEIPVPAGATSSPVAGNADVVQAPGIPSIIEIASEVIRWAEGKAIVDVVLNIQTGDTQEFEVRIAKNEGNV